MRSVQRERERGKRGERERERGGADGGKNATELTAQWEGRGERQGEKCSHIQAAHFLTNYCCKTSLSPSLSNWTLALSLFFSLTLSPVPLSLPLPLCGKNWRAASTAGGTGDRICSGKKKKKKRRQEPSPKLWRRDRREGEGVIERYWWLRGEGCGWARQEEKRMMQKRKEKRGQRKDEPSRLTPKNTTSGSHCIQDQSGASVFLALESPEPLSISQLLGYKRLGSGEEVRLPKNSQRARDHRAQSSACCEQAPMSTHRKYPAVVQCVCVCVWVSRSLFCILTEQDGGKSPFSEPVAVVPASW